MWVNEWVVFVCVWYRETHKTRTYTSTQLYMQYFRHTIFTLYFYIYYTYYYCYMGKPPIVNVFCGPIVSFDYFSICTKYITLWYYEIILPILRYLRASIYIIIHEETKLLTHFACAQRGKKLSVTFFSNLFLYKRSVVIKSNRVICRVNFIFLYRYSNIVMLVLWFPSWRWT